MTDLEFLQKWYAAHCDGDWEHQSGVTISTLDNPGWNLEVDLAGTELADQTYEAVEINRSVDDWCVVKVDGQTFSAAGGLVNLAEGLEHFKAFASALQEPILHREQHVVVYTDRSGTEHWAVMNVQSRSAINDAFPELRVVNRPEWLPADFSRSDLKELEWHRLEDPPSGLLELIIEARLTK